MEESGRFGGDSRRAKYHTWKQPTNTGKGKDYFYFYLYLLIHVAKPTGLKRKLAGRIEYPTKESEEERPKHVAPRSPPPKVVRRGDVSGTVSLPQKQGSILKTIPHFFFLFLPFVLFIVLFLLI